MARVILLGTETVGDAGDVRAAVAEARRCGFHGVEWAVAAEGSEESSLLADLKNFENAGGTGPISESDRPVHAFSLALHTVRPSEAIDTLIRVLNDTMHLCPCSLTLVCPPLHPEGSGEIGFSRYQDGLNFAYQVLRGLRFEAEAAGVRVAIKAARGGCLLSPVEVRDLIDAANSPAMGVCVDVDLVSRVGDPLDWLATLGPRVGVVRAGGAGQSFRRLAEALDELRFAGPVVVKHDVPVEDRRGLVEGLRKD